MKVRRSILFGLMFGIALLSSCGEGAPSKDRKRLKVVATTGMIADALNNIVGEDVEVIGLMGPGVDPHLYKATQRDLSHLSEADVIFYNGLHLEGQMGAVLEKLSERKSVVAITDGINREQLLKPTEYNGNYDPHIWFDVGLWKEGVTNIASGMKKYDSEGAAVYDVNLKEYLLSLDSLNLWVEEQIETIPEESRVLITAHDAFGYFGRAYGIEVRGLQGISTVTEYGLADLRNLVQLIVDRNVKAVFVETSINSEQIKPLVEGVEARGSEITVGGELFSDAMGSQGTPEGTYVGMVRSNVNTIVNALR